MCKILIGVTVHKNKIVDDWKFQMLKSRETNNSIKQYPPGQNPERRVLCTCTPICPICPICPPRFSMEETDWEPWLDVGEEVERKLKEDRKHMSQDCLRHVDVDGDLEFIIDKSCIIQELLNCYS